MINIPLSKLKAIFLYFANNTDRKYLGKVKMMKLFYFLDFGHVKKYGSPVTFDRYLNMGMGPIPSTVMNLVDVAVEENDKSFLSDVVGFETPTNTKMLRFTPKRDFGKNDEKLFTKTELEVLRSVSKRFYSATADQIKGYSHNESPWKKTKLMDEIPYTLAADDKDCQVTREEIELLTRITGSS